MTETKPALPHIDDLIRAGALFVANHVTATRIGDCCRRCFPTGIPNEGGSP